MKRSVKTIVLLMAAALFAVSCSKTSSNNGEADEGGDQIGIIDTKLPVDENPDSYNFKRRILVTDHTGTDCGQCPFVVCALNKISETDELKDKMVVIKSYYYSAKDPLRCKASVTLGNYLKTEASVPYVHIDLSTANDMKKYGTNNNSDSDMRALLPKLRKAYEKAKAKIGICASSEVNGDVIEVRAGVKIGEPGKYKIGAFLVEDGVKAAQQNWGAKGYDFNTHNGTLRQIFDLKNIAGKELGSEELKQGDIEITDFTFDAKENIKDINNCRVIIYVTTPDEPGSAKFYVNNVISCKVGESVPFDYEASEGSNQAE